MPLQPLDLSWLGGGVGGLLRSGRATNEGGSAFGGQRNLGKDFLEGVGTATDERFASEAKKARSLRTYLGELDPSLKDKVQAMGLGDLEGHAMKLAEDKLAEKARLNEEYLRAQITAMNEAGQARGKQANANQLFGQYAGRTTPPSAAALSDYYDTTSAEQPNRPQPTRDILGAYFRAQQESGAAPDISGLGSLMHYLPGQEAPAQRDFVPRPFSVNGMEGIYSPETGSIHVKQSPSATAVKPTVDQFDRMDYAELGRSLAELEKEFAKTTNLDARNELVSSMNRIKANMQRIRQRQTGGQPSNNAPAAPAPAARPTVRFQLLNGELIPAQ